MESFDLSPNTPLTDDELTQLDQFLQSDRAPEGTLWIDELDGLFAALICGPHSVDPSEWLPAVWNGKAPLWASAEEEKGITALMIRHWNAVSQAIIEEHFEPVFRYGIDDAGNEADDPAGWCYGFIEGVAMWGVEDWDSEELRTLITPMVALRDEQLEEQPDDEVTEKLKEPGVRDRLIDMLPDVVAQLREYWIDNPAPIFQGFEGDDLDDDEDARPTAKAPRRDDPCPCGSGKKYKNCCGAPA